MRNCVCGKPIPHNRQLCSSCIEIYGSDQTKWAEWLKFWVQDYQRELDCENMHRHFSIDVNEGIVEPKPTFKLNGCRTETHLYQDRHKHGG